LQKSSLWFCSYGTPIGLKFPDGDYIRIQFHHKGVGATKAGKTTVAVTPTQACISSNGVEIDFGRDFQQIVWRVSRPVLAQKLATLTGLPVTAGLDFDPAVDMTRPESMIMTQIMTCLLQAADTVAAGPSGFILAELEGALMTAFLAASNFGCRHMLQREVPQVAPWQVRRAESYIESNWDRSITIEDLVEVTGTSARSLFRTFKQTRGYTPLEFARRIRLNEARRMLSEPLPSTTVTDVALVCGFSDLSRFSKDYAQGFGELPSTTLNRIRGSRQPIH
jgi:AraC-like DNA-binding protein